MTTPNLPDAAQAARESIGREVRERRKAAGIGLERLARMAEVWPIVLRRIEAGAISATPEELARIDRALGPTSAARGPG